MPHGYEKSLHSRAPEENDDQRFAKCRNTATGVLSSPALTGMAAAASSMRMNSGYSMTAGTIDDANHDATTTGPNNGRSSTAVPTLEQLPAMVAGVMGDDPVVYVECTKQFRRLLSVENPPIQEVIDSGVLERFVYFLLDDECPEAQIDAAWILASIASGTPDHLQAVVNVNAVPYLEVFSQAQGFSRRLFELLLNPSPEVQKPVLRAVGNILAGKAEQIKILVQQGIIRPLCTLLNSPNAEIVSIALEGLANILKVGYEEAKSIGGTNQMAAMIPAEGLTKIKNLQLLHSNICVKCDKILEAYFGVEDEEKMAAMAPAAVGTDQQQQQQPQAGFDVSGAGAQ
jgi:Armadillo/beta-catenin-like repeat